MSIKPVQTQALARLKTTAAEGEPLDAQGKPFKVGQKVGRAASEIHDKWLERNGSWARDDQKVPFAQLSEEEKNKDRDQIRILLNSLDNS